VGDDDRDLLVGWDLVEQFKQNWRVAEGAASQALSVANRIIGEPRAFSAV
jgi:hypothetical protein